MSSHFDLNIPSHFYEAYLKHNDPAFLALIQQATRDGYTGMAVNFDIGQQLPQEKHMVTLQLPEGLQKSFRVFSRLTMTFQDMKQLQHLSDVNKVVSSFDLVAVRCTNDKIFHALCQDSDYFDIITFDLANRMPFLLRRTSFNAAIERGIMFEINYSEAISDPLKRKTIYQNAAQIIKSLRSKNIIFSSEAKDGIFHRSPSEVVTIAVSLGMTVDHAIRCVSSHQTLCLQRCKFRKSYKGTICEATEDDVQEFERLKEDRKAKKVKKEPVDLDALIHVD